MKLNYKLTIPNPENHLAHILINTKRTKADVKLKFYIPSWSPGSYLMREYGKNIQNFKALNKNGERLNSLQVDKGIYEIDFNGSDVKNKDELDFSISYEVYCHELSVRTSHIDRSHAFIHGPSVFMNVLGLENTKPTLEVIVNPLWSKVTTTLKEVSTKRDEFRYEALNYDELIDTPIELGCHETDGFLLDGIPHELAFYGHPITHDFDVKGDIKKIVDHIQKSMNGMPYERYLFLTHLGPGLFGGLEHLNSTALQYCSYTFSTKKGYKEWLELVAHEYFHLWNVKRIRPIELGPFDYLNENFTRMHWLTEGLTSFMDQFFIFRTEFYSLEDYLECLKFSINRYLNTPGRKFHSVEDSSFNTWIKLYRPDENSANSSVSYYLKGGLIFLVLHLKLLELNKDIFDVVMPLWDRFKANEKIGVTEDEVFEIVKKASNQEVMEEFIHLVKGVDDIDFEKYFKNCGIDFEYEEVSPDLGIVAEFKEQRVIVKSVLLDSSAYKYGLNAGDEILSVSGLRFLKSDFEKRDKFFALNKKYTFLVSRLGHIQEVEVLIGNGLRKVKSLKVSKDKKEQDVIKLLKGKMPNA